MKNIAVFLDRDGTVSEEVGYVNHLSRYRLFPWTATAIKRLNEAGLKAILVTNQAGVARGYFTEDLIWKVHEKLTSELTNFGAHLAGIYYCPHHPSAGKPPYRANCECRKPKPGLLYKAAQENEIDLTRSFMVGDKYTDIELAQRIGLKGVMVMTGYGIGEYEYQREAWPQMPDKIATDLLEAVDWIITQAK
ncbi:MAG: D-glycero-D-manno-heptose 1 7-bisphosphate phosphatase [bacterium]|nr:MAG: D-glycero-D-manno-heptose 1 7-bisphosphate phosphatase [bacterium]